MNTNKIKELAGIAHDKRASFEALRTASVPTDPEEAKKLTVAYEIAKAEMFEADTNLLKEQRP